jgi:hypothetical protein
VASVQVNDYRNGYRSFRSGNGYYKQGKENAIQLIGVQVFVECHKIDVHTIQDQFDRHQHGDQVAPGEQPIHADKK